MLFELKQIGQRLLPKLLPETRAPVLSARCYHVSGAHRGGMGNVANVAACIRAHSFELTCSTADPALALDLCADRQNLEEILV